ncbi:hypothetical protein ACPEEZ_00695 [Frigoribacterium sp. 2-23]|uniref:hypothetical protein n=1 Tax=Frigoribacterium sp. 2-23 TaxID=3415006 RepID=UPI003C6EAD72
MGWWRRVLGGPYDDRDRARRLDSARGPLRDGWTRDDLRALGAPVTTPWATGKGRDAGAAAPEHVDEGERLIAAVDAVALELRASGTAFR